LLILLKPPLLDVTLGLWVGGGRVWLQLYKAVVRRSKGSSINSKNIPQFDLN
jgi:hypothetical protein